ncbi:MAG: restriction endonuclease subunit S [Ardenticatenales bacterium]|nr:restriction endonuclease subunit S [Ardenticatenales bacterium]
MSLSYRSLNSLLEKSGTDRAGQRDYPLLSITMRDGLVDQSEKFKKRIASQDTTKYRVAYRNELVVGFPIDEGVLGFQTRHPAGIVSPAYDIWKLKEPAETHIPYLERYLRSTQARLIYASKMQGAVARRRSLTKADFLDLEVPFPPLNDQKRIAHLLSTVEKIIARRKQHLQQFDDLLKSVFLEMFGDPVENEKEWPTVPFHRVGQFISGGTPTKSRSDFWSGDFPWVSPKDMKVSKIEDAADHISETVFEETTLKRIAPGHLLMVVRGMILAHSFPVAINTVEIAINQDMKAIKPIKGISVTYLQNCLISLKRQILKLISTAGHGTRKFDSIAMQKLLIPKPPEELQNQFAAIVEKVEGIKNRYQQSLADLETLCSALSHKAFKGELDLSRIPLPTEHLEITQDDKLEAEDGQSVEPTLTLPAPADLGALHSLEGRKTLLNQWLASWLERLGDAPFAAQPFMEAAGQRFWELEEGDEPMWGVAEYDALKAWVFEALENGRLTQRYDDATNRIVINVAKG